jgi:glycosyltransferase involved in cell wall biosynthesis
MKKRVLQVLPALNVGGVERGVIDLSILSKNSPEFTFIVASSGGKLTSKLKDANIKHIQFNLKTKNPIKIIKNAFILARICKTLKIDILHARSRSVAYSGYLACKLNKKTKFITTFHGVYSFKYPLKKLYNSIMLKGQKVIAVSNFVKSHILQNYKVDEAKIVVINRGANVNYFNDSLVDKYPLSQNTKLIFVPGRISRWKGQELLIDALFQIKDENFLCLLVGGVGESNFGNFLQQKINGYSLGEKIKIMDAIDDIRPLYKACNLVVVPSLRPEAFGRIGVEAGAFGKYVIAFNYGGLAETIINGKTGSLVTPLNVNELSNSIKLALNFSSIELKEISLNAKNHITQNYTLEKMFKETVTVYKGL